MLPKMRTVKELIEIAKKEDPETKLTLAGIRRLIITGELPSVKVGSKYLVSLEVFSDFLSGKFSKPTDIEKETQRIAFDSSSETGILYPAHYKYCGGRKNVLQ